MLITVVRRYKGEHYTIGSMYINGKYVCDTLEDTVRDEKIANKTAIPQGSYTVSLTMSPAFKRALPHIEKVPNFEGVRIHRGNTPEDTAGCILVGENKVKGKVLNSTKYEMLIVEEMLNNNNRAVLLIR